MKITISKKKIGKGDKEFTVLETEIFNTPVRLSKALTEKLKDFKPHVTGSAAEYDLDDATTGKLTLTASTKNGYTTCYLTLKKDHDKEEGLPF